MYLPQQTSLIVSGLTELGLFGACFYSATPYSTNEKYAKIRHPYSDLDFLYFTNISLYLTLLTVVIGIIYRYKKSFSSIYNVLLPMALSLEIIVTIMFWSLYMIDPALIKNKNSLLPGYETPIITELGQHLFPVILLSINQRQMKIIYHKFQTLAFITLLIIWYTVVTIIAHQRGKYIYRFMSEIKNDQTRFALFCLFIAIAYLIHRTYIKIKARSSSSKNSK